MSRRNRHRRAASVGVPKLFVRAPLPGPSKPGRLRIPMTPREARTGGRPTDQAETV